MFGAFLIYFFKAKRLLCWGGGLSPYVIIRPFDDVGVFSLALIGWKRDTIRASRRPCLWSPVPRVRRFGRFRKGGFTVRDQLRSGPRSRTETSQSQSQSQRNRSMDRSNGFSPDRNILCLFDVDGTLTAPREVRDSGSSVLLPRPVPSRFASRLLRLRNSRLSVDRLAVRGLAA